MEEREIRCGDRVKVIALQEEKAMNLWGGYDDVTVFLNQEGIVRNIYDGSTLYARYGIEFDDDYVQLTRVRTGLIFGKEQLQVIPVLKETVAVVN